MLNCQVIRLKGKVSGVYSVGGGGGQGEIDADSQGEDENIIRKGGERVS